MTYEEVYNQINNAHRFGNHPGVEVAREMLRILGYPAMEIPYFHVAGTNGKGSTCAFLTELLMARGERVGTFTSPHLVDMEERFTVNNCKMSKEDARRLGQRLLEADFPLAPTMFDYCLTMALLYFEEQHCTVMVIETGLGGALDSTNALPHNPLCSVITRIGFDHMAILGNTLTKIACEKAGIMKRHTPVVVSPQEPEAAAALLCYYHEHFDKANASAYYQVVPQEEITRMSAAPFRLRGLHQWENAALAKTAFETVYPAFSPEETCRILGETVWMGRMEILSETPFLMVDGAHNGHGVAALGRSLAALYPGKKFHFLMGVMADKDYPEMIKELLPLALDFCTYTPESERALQARELACYISSCGVAARECCDLEQYLSSLPEDAPNVAFGSLYFIGDLEALWAKRKKE